jgi:hypothetical protein
MYPNTFLSLFPPFPRDHRAFVAMSFLSRFEHRWKDVLEPAIKRVLVNGRALEPHRVDLGKASDSILTEILQGIGGCRVFVGDISTLDHLDGRPIRNANVLYEIGLAHASRLPEEVVLLRSDSDELVFDVANVRVLRYDPDGAPDVARTIVTEAIVESLRELDLRKALAVTRAAASLDVHSWLLLLEASGGGGLHHPSSRTMGEVLAGTARTQSIWRLLELGALGASLVRLTTDVARAPLEELATYRITEFGQAVARYGRRELGLDSPEIQSLLRTGPEPPPEAATTQPNPPMQSPGSAGG